MNIKIDKCDLCGYEIRSDKKNRHWTDSIGHAIISFKDVDGSQQVPFDGHCCMTCAKVLSDQIGPLIRKIKDDHR